MQLKNVLGSFAFAAMAATMGGCLVTAHARIAEPVAVVEVEDDPPPPRMMMEVRPGFVAIQGRWNWTGGRWVWRDGYYERERAGYAYEQGHWERRGRGHVWVDGGWRGGGATPAVRDHREERKEERHEDHHEGPVVRDHR